MASKNIYIKKNVSFCSITKALIMPLLLLPLLGDSIKPLLQEKSKVSNP